MSTSFELLNTPDELISQKPVIQAHRIELYSNFKSKEERKKKQSERKAHRKEKRAAAKEERKGMGLGKRLLNLSQKANPAAIVPRSSFLLGLRVNIFGISRRLYPATLTEAELIKKGFDVENARKAKEVIEKKFAPVWAALGGRKISLYENIKKGFAKPIFKTKKVKAMQKQIKENEAKADAKTNKVASSFEGDANDNTLYNPHRVQGVLYQLYVSQPVVEPLSNFDANEIDLGINADKMNLSFNGEEHSNFVDLSEAMSTKDCAACSSFDGDEYSGFVDLSEAMSTKDCSACSSFDGDLRKAEEIDAIDNFSNVSGYDDAAIAAYISAGLGIAGSLVKMISNAGVKKNPYKEGTPEYAAAEKDNAAAAKSGATTPPPVDEAAMKEIKDAAATDAKKGISEEEVAKEEEKVTDEVAKEVGADDKILGMNKTVFWSGAILLGLGAAFAVYKLRGKGTSVPKV